MAPPHQPWQAIVQGVERNRRVAQQLHRELVPLLRELNDPALAVAPTITRVSVSRDLSLATIYIQMLEDEDVTRMLAGLGRASGYLRRQIGARLHMKKIPELRFRHDEKLAQADRLDHLLSTLGSGTGENFG